MDEKNMIEKYASIYQIGHITELNDITTKYGISISKEDAKLLMEEKTNSLREKQRVEFGEGVLTRLISTFCDSTYLYQENFTESIARLQDIFYEYKNESMDELTDSELIDYMKLAFDGECRGSLDYLEETVLEKFARDIREKGQKFLEYYFKKGDNLDE